MGWNEGKTEEIVSFVDGCYLEVIWKYRFICLIEIVFLKKDMGIYK